MKQENLDTIQEVLDFYKKSIILTLEEISGQSIELTNDVRLADILYKEEDHRCLQTNLNIQYRFESTMKSKLKNTELNRYYSVVDLGLRLNRPVSYTIDDHIKVLTTLLHNK